MISALIISIAVAIISMVFFIDARSTIAKLKQEADARDILTLGKVSNDPEKEEQRGTVDSQDGWALTPELVADAIKFCGYVPDVRENLVAFKVQGDDFYVRTDNVCRTVRTDLSFRTVRKVPDADTSGLFFRCGRNNI